MVFIEVDNDHRNGHAILANFISLRRLHSVSICILEIRIVAVNSVNHKYSVCPLKLQQLILFRIYVNFVQNLWWTILMRRDNYILLHFNCNGFYFVNFSRNIKVSESRKWWPWRWLNKRKTDLIHSQLIKYYPRLRFDVVVNFLQIVGCISESSWVICAFHWHWHIIEDLWYS